MKEMKIPESHQRIMPYLIVQGADKFLQFLREVFNGEETYREMRDEKRIRHAEARIGDCTIMLADSTEQFEPNTMSLFIYVNDADKTYQAAMDKGAASIEEPTDRSYGRSCGIKDPFGNTWWITSVK